VGLLVGGRVASNIVVLLRIQFGVCMLYALLVLFTVDNRSLEAYLVLFCFVQGSSVLGNRLVGCFLGGRGVDTTRLTRMDTKEGCSEAIGATVTNYTPAGQEFPTWLSIQQLRERRQRQLRIDCPLDFFRVVFGSDQSDRHIPAR
jgi:hypothetical protein